MTDKTTAELVRDFTGRIESIEDEIAALNASKSDCYRAAKEADVDVKALRTVIAYRRRRNADPKALSAAEARVSEYLAYADAPAAAPRVHARKEKPEPAIEVPTDAASRVHVHARKDEPAVGEKTAGIAVADTTVPIMPQVSDLIEDLNLSAVA